MKWTTEPPTEEGFYWYGWKSREHGDRNYNFIRIQRGTITYLGSEVDEHLDDFEWARWSSDNVWYGPLPIPLEPPELEE